MSNGFFTSFTNVDIKNAHVDEGKALLQKLALKAELAKNTKLARNSVTSVSSVAKQKAVSNHLTNSPFLLRVFVSLWQKSPKKVEYFRKFSNVFKRFITFFVNFRPFSNFFKRFQSFLHHFFLAYFTQTLQTKPTSAIFRLKTAVSPNITPKNT